MLVFSYTIFQGNGFSIRLVFRFFFFLVNGGGILKYEKWYLWGFTFIAFFCGSVFGWRGIESIDWYRVYIEDD